MDLVQANRGDEIHIATVMKDKNAKEMSILKRDVASLVISESASHILKDAETAIATINMHRSTTALPVIDFAIHLIVAPHVRPAIISASLDLSASFIVLGSRGLSLINQLRVGSVSSYVISNAKCPVIIVRETETETASSSAAVHELLSKKNPDFYKSSPPSHLLEQQ